MRRLEDTILRHAARLRGQNWDVGSIYNNFSCTKRGNILELFDRKVTEADAYLQLLIEQVHVSYTLQMGSGIWYFGVSH